MRGKRELMEFIELPSFTAAVEESSAEESLMALQLELIANPMKGDVIQGTGGFRKVRMRLPGRGKSGSLRAIYLYFLDRDRIYLAMLYRKKFVILCLTIRRLRYEELQPV